MNHRPFEDWLLNDQPLTHEQTRELQTHLNACAHCTALNEVNLELHSVKMAAPSAGFTARFQQRLAVQRVVERRNRLVGIFILILGGVGLLGWTLAPYAIQFLGNPAGWIAGFVHFFLSLFGLLRAVGDLGLIFVRILPGFIPPFGWMILLSTLGGFALLWSISLWRFTRFVKGV